LNIKIRKGRYVYTALPSPLFFKFQQNAGPEMSVQDMISGINGSDAELQMKATRAVRKILSKEKNPPIDDIIQSGVIPRLVEFLSHNDR